MDCELAENYLRVSLDMQKLSPFKFPAYICHRIEFTEPHFSWTITTQKWSSLHMSDGIRRRAEPSRIIQWFRRRRSQQAPASSQLETTQQYSEPEVSNRALEDFWSLVSIYVRDGRLENHFYICNLPLTLSEGVDNPRP